jgi:hypothetical protein
MIKHIKQINIENKIIEFYCSNKAYHLGSSLYPFYTFFIALLETLVNVSIKSLQSSRFEKIPSSCVGKTHTGTIVLGNAKSSVRVVKSPTCTSVLGNAISSASARVVKSQRLLTNDRDVRHFTHLAHIKTSEGLSYSNLSNLPVLKSLIDELDNSMLSGYNDSIDDVSRRIMIEINRILDNHNSVNSKGYVNSYDILDKVKHPYMTSIIKSIQSKNEENVNVKDKENVNVNDLSVRSKTSLIF